MSPTSPHHKAIEHLKKIDPVMADVISRVGKCTLEPREEWTHFDALVRSIVYQQLSGKAAATIHGRVLALIGDGAEAPQRIVATSHDALRAAGLSNQKASYVRNLAEHVLDLTGSKSQLVHRPLPADDPLQRQPNTTRAKEMLGGWQPKVQLRDGLSKTIGYFDRLLAGA